MTDPHAACLAEPVRYFEEHHDVVVDAMEWPDHCCPMFKQETCRPHGRGIWVHPSMGQCLAWLIELDTASS